MYKVTSLWAHQDSVKVEWNLGKRCNYDCSYCPESIHDNNSPHTDIDILKSAVDKLVEIGRPIRLSFTGGEPTVHPKFEELLYYARVKGINWISITTNGTRTPEWYINNQALYNHLTFSLHFEHDWQRVITTIIRLKEQLERDFFVNIMAHHDKMTEVHEAVRWCTALDIKYAIRRVRWTEGDHNLFDDLRYNLDDLNWILEHDATAPDNCVTEDKEKNIKLYHANDIIKLHLNNFKGWRCSAGIESLMINWDGDVHRATCRVGGSLGNIYTGSFNIPTEYITCTRDWCTCAADIPLTKFSL